MFTDPYQIDEEDDKSVELITIENMDLIQKCYPDVVQAFIDAKSGISISVMILLLFVCCC